MGEKLVLIDGHSILNRAFYGLPILTNSEGIYTNAVLGFLNIMFKILDEEKPDYLTVAFDVHHPTFRHEMFEAYKGTRKSMPEELRPQVSLLKEVLQAMNITIIEKPGYEADDILGTLAKMGEAKGLNVSLISGDRDLLQLASDNIKIRIPKTKKGGTEIENYNANEVIETYGVTPTQFIDLKGLMGDTSDNIPGVPGIGEKTAQKIIINFDTIENAYIHIEEVTPPKAKESLRNNYDQAILSKVLATIKVDCELDYDMSNATLDNFYNDNTYHYFKKLEFKNLLNRFSSQLSQGREPEQAHEFAHIMDRLAAEKMFENMYATKTDVIPGFYFVIEKGSLLGLSVTFGENDRYFLQTSSDITIEYLKNKLSSFLVEKNRKLSSIHVKQQLGFFDEGVNQGIFDIMIAAYLLNPLSDSYEYDDIGRDYLNEVYPSYTELFGKLDFSKAIDEKKKEFLNYCINISYVAFKVTSILEKALNEANMLTLFNDIEIPLVYALYDMEQRGIRVNKAALKEYGDKLAITIARLEQEIYGYVGEEFNINSPKQLGVILFEKMHMPFGKKTKTGYSTSADILEKLKSEHPVVSLILDYRQVTKLKSTYADGLAVYIGEDERIHGKFHQTIAATGRISSTEPNLQNIPIRMELGREIRKVFIPKEGYLFLDADYSQIELRVLAHMSGDERLIEAYKEDQDIHRITASQVFHTPMEEVTSLQRRNAKAVNFGIVYGISSFGLGQDLNITRKEAETYINKYFETYPKVKIFLDELVGKGKADGYVTTIFNRKRPIPELSSSNFMSRSFGERVAMNSPIQGTAADIIKIAMIRVNDKLKALKLKSRLILQIHDELLIETHQEEVELVSKILKDEMQNSAELAVPLLVDVNRGNNWYEAK